MGGAGKIMNSEKFRNQIEKIIDEKSTEQEIEEKANEVERRELIEVLKKECSEPIPGIKDMPVYPFKDLMEKFRTSNLRTVTESEEYKKMISNGFIIGLGEQRVYYGEKLGVHLGVDYMVNEETKVSAIADGEVVGVRSVRAPRIGRKRFYKGEGGYGNAILIEHKLESGQKVYSLYGHLKYSKEQPKIGDIVKKGQIIGQVGRSFSVENGGWPSHLHFSILREREAVAGYGTIEDTKKIIDPCKVFEKGN